MLSMPIDVGCFLASNALSTMGFAIPAAIAARSCSDRPVLAFVGDGSLLMRATELMAERGPGRPLVVVALMDASLSQIEIKQERQSLKEVGVELPEFSCAQLGAFLGIEGVDVDTAEDLAAAVRRGMAISTPVLIGARVAPESSRTIFELLRG
jgi:acetolactate synthase-1/2/3 large subunit